MIIKQIVDEDFVNYKKPSMFIGFPKCSFKCGLEYCHNSPMATAKGIEISSDDIVKRFIENPISEAFVFGGLEPFDSPNELLDLMYTIRIVYDLTCDIVIYTGYTEQECIPRISPLFENIGWSEMQNVIVKYGRYLPNQEPHFDEVLGVKLASPNQYAMRLCK